MGLGYTVREGIRLMGLVVTGLGGKGISDGGIRLDRITRGGIR